jgi:hypothetical protein
VFDIHSTIYMQPNTDELHLDPITKKEVWEEYCQDPFVLTNEEEQLFLSYSQFVGIWNNCFPKVKIREYKNVCGKCALCEGIKEIMHATKSRSMRIIFRRYKLLHRAFYMGEKLLYYQRRAEAACSNGSIGSVIVDKMGLGNTALPICGHSLKFTPAFQVSVTGAICHTNNKTTFYLSTPNFKTTASLTIHILLMELKKLYEANDSKPLSKVYIEIDGAGDNTAKAVHGFAEHMIVKKFTSLLIICRLPVGHTHEDIDSR